MPVRYWTYELLTFNVDGAEYIFLQIHSEEVLHFGVEVLGPKAPTRSEAGLIWRHATKIKVCIALGE